jgi:putative hydrolase of the HAD superfamily
VINYLLFDLDNTLYSCSYGLEDNVRRRIKEYSAKFLGVSVEEAWRQRKELAHIYGTNLEWLMAEKGFADPETYLAAVHPPDEADSLPPDPRRRAFLESIPIPKAIITNSPMEHADLILGKLGFENLFTHIFDIRFCNYTGKPHPMVFHKALEILGVGVETVLFIDDVPRYVEGFLALGGKGLLLDENDHWHDYPHPRIRRLEEFVGYLE